MSGDKVAGDKVMSGKRTVNTLGGDYAEGDIDKRIVYGDVIGQQVVQPALSPALHHLRAPVADFVDREREIDELVQTLRKAATNGTVAAISSVRGMGGTGKTELAYVVAKRLKDAFLDTQILGSSPSRPSIGERV